MRSQKGPNAGGLSLISTNAMAKRHLEALGYRTDITQHWIQHHGSRFGHRRDFFNCIDVVGLKGRQWLNVQACESESIHRAKKQARQNPAVRDIEAGPTDFEIWEFYDSGDGWWIRRWSCLIADGHVVDFAVTADEPSLDKEKEKARQKAARRKDKQKATSKADGGIDAADDTPF